MCTRSVFGCVYVNDRLLSTDICLPYSNKWVGYLAVCICPEYTRSSDSISQWGDGGFPGRNTCAVQTLRPCCLGKWFHCVPRALRVRPVIENREQFREIPCVLTIFLPVWRETRRTHRSNFDVTFKDFMGKWTLE